MDEMKCSSGYWVDTDTDDVPSDSPVGTVVQLPDGNWAVRVREAPEEYPCGRECCGYSAEWEGFFSEEDARAAASYVLKERK